MQAAKKFDRPRTVDNPVYSEPKPAVTEDEPEVPPWNIRIGKMIFYLTVAVAVWFFYWFNGIQCPC